MIVISILATLLFLLETSVFSIVSVFVSLIDRSGKWYLRLARLWARFSLLVFGIRLKVTGTEHIEQGKHYIYVANHSSYSDILLVIGAIPDDIRLIFRSTLTRIPIWGWSMLLSPFILIDRSNAKKAQSSLAKAVETMRKGASVLLFPEGTRTATGEMQSFKRGAFHLAYESGEPIIPVAIVGAYDIISRHDILPRWGRRAEIRIGKAIYSRVVSAAESRAEEIRLMKEAEESVRNLLAN